MLLFKKRFFSFLMGLLVLLSAAGCTSAESTDSGAILPDGNTTHPETTAETTVETTAESTTATTVVTIPATTQPPVVIPEIHPDTVGIYIPAADGTAARKHITEFVAARTAKKDIDCFEILASQADVVKGSSFRSLWTDTWNAHTGNENAKIGFRIAFTLTGGEQIDVQLLKPSDSKSFFDYLEIYMYDDIHQTPGVWYTHLSDKDMKADTIISSIKLTSGSRISEVGDISLTAFIYTGDECFDPEGNYIGLVSETILIKTP